MTILIADDELRLRKVVALYLRKCGYAVIEAENGEQALELARKNDPDVIIMDVMMPVMSGIEATLEIKKDSALKSKPVILLTANAGEKDYKIGSEAGADVYMTKPFSPKELLETISGIASPNR